MIKTLILLILMFPVVAWADHRPPPPNWTEERIRETDEAVKQAKICPLEGSPEALQREQAARERGIRPLFPHRIPTQEERDYFMQHACSDADNLLSQWDYRHFGSGKAMNLGGMVEIRESDRRQDERWTQRRLNPTWYWATIIDCPTPGSVEDQERQQWYRARVATQKHLTGAQREQQDIDDMKSGNYLRPCMDPEVRYLYEKLKEKDESCKPGQCR